jgi:hypothetical protein
MEVYLFFLLICSCGCFDEYHSSREMMERYTHADKVIDFNKMREKLDRAVGM